MKTQYAFHFDSSRCTGCKTCVIACRDKNDIQDPKLAFRTVHEETGGSWSRNEDGSWSQNVWAYFVSVSCNHCSEPACVRVCPTGAHARHEELGGLVLIDRDVCTPPNLILYTAKKKVWCTNSSLLIPIRLAETKQPA